MIPIRLRQPLNRLPTLGLIPARTPSQARENRGVRRTLLRGIWRAMPMKVREIIRLLERNGWKEIRSKGSHRHFTHPDRRRLITVPGNEGKELAPGTLHAILKMAGLK